MRCPRCQSLCTEGDLTPLVYEKRSALVRVETPAGVAYVGLRAAEALGLHGRICSTSDTISQDTTETMRVVQTPNGEKVWLTAQAATLLGYRGRDIRVKRRASACGACRSELANRPYTMA